jgi:hypothetical protein
MPHLIRDMAEEVLKDFHPTPGLRPGCRALRYAVSEGAMKNGKNGGKRSEIAALEFLNTADEVLEFRICDPDLAFNAVYLIQQLPDPDVHQVNDELLDYDNCAKQYQHVSFVCHECSKNGIT